MKIRYMLRTVLILRNNSYRNEDKLKQFREEAKVMQRKKDAQKYFNGGKLGKLI